MKKWIKAVFWAISAAVSIGLFVLVAHFNAEQGVSGSNALSQLEYMAYIISAICYITAFLALTGRMQSTAAKLYLNVGCAFAFTVQTLLYNNLLRYIGWLAQWGEEIVSYTEFIMRDLEYSVGLGEFRYAAVFAGMFLLGTVCIAIEKKYFAE